MGQQSQYVDLREGSRKYIYEHGSGVKEFGSYGKFIHALLTHARLSGMKGNRLKKLKQSLESQYGTHTEEGKHIGPKAEMAHILSEHLDWRLEGMELTETDDERLQEWADESFVV